MYTRRSLELYRSEIGRARIDAVTPALLLDLDAAKRNIASMAARFASRSAVLRPHVKVHKSPQLALLQMEAGAIGVTCATVWEAEAMAEVGIHDILIANQVVQPDKVEALAELARCCLLTVAVDDIRNVDALDAASGAAGSRLELLIELDIDMGRCGVRAKEELLAVARHISGKENVRFRGVQGYEGHCMLEPDASVRERKALAAYCKLREAVDFLSASGFPPEVVSGGGTGTYAWAGADPVFTEIQVGSYALMDGFHDGLIPGAFEPALTVLGTVISEQGSTVVLDAGSKSIDANEGSLQIKGIDYEAIRFDEEHGIVTFAGAPKLHLGDRAELVPGYGPSTVNLYDVYYVVERDIIIDVWPVMPRGPGRP